MRRRGAARAARGARAARAAAAAVTALAALLLAGCAALPTSGPVHQGLDNPNAEPPLIQAVAAGPVKDASPEQIVQGFLQATLAGGSDDFAVARSYLTEDTATVWDPSAGVAIYPYGDEPSLAAESDPAQVRLSFTQVAQVDPSGRYAQTPPVAQSRGFTAAQDDDEQWRLSSVPDGIVIPEDVFHGDYTEGSVYFASPDGRFLVPDVRWFPRRTAATSLVGAFLEGPPEYLAGAVGPGAPPGTRLATDAVHVEGGVATVNLTAEVRSSPETQRALILACLEASLKPLPGVSTVKMQVESAPLDVAGSTSGPAADPQAPSAVYYLSDGGLWEFSGTGASLVEGFEGTAGWSSVTVDRDAARVAGLADGALVYQAKGATEVPLAGVAGEGKPTAEPVFDAMGTLWAGSFGQVVAFGVDGAATPVGAPWLAGRTVLGIAPARDGVRIAVISRAASGEVRLDVAGIVRAEGGGPASLTTPLAATTAVGVPLSIAWADEVTLAVLAPRDTASSPVPQLITVGGSTAELNPPSDEPTSMTAGRTLYELYMTGASGGLYLFTPQGRIWTSQAGAARAVTFGA